MFKCKSCGNEALFYADASVNVVINIEGKNTQITTDDKPQYSLMDSWVTCGNCDHSGEAHLFKAD